MIGKAISFLFSAFILFSCNGKKGNQVKSDSAVKKSYTSFQLDSIRDNYHGKKITQNGKCDIDFDTLHLTEFYSASDSTGALMEKTFYTNKDLQLEFYYYPDGKTQKLILRNSFYDANQQNIEKHFSENGEQTFESFEIRLSNCPDDHSGELSSYVYFNKDFYQNKIIDEEQFYFEAWGDSDEDSVGVWKYYDNGKLIRTKKFHSWQDAYQKDHHCKPDFEIPYKG